MAYGSPTWATIPTGDGSEATFLVREQSSTSAKVQYVIDTQPGAMGAAEAWYRYAFSFIKSWTLKDGNGADLPLTFETFDCLPDAAKEPLMQHVSRVFFASSSKSASVEKSPQ